MDNKYVACNNQQDFESGISLDKSIHHFFEEQVTKTPDSVALVCKDESVTFRELNSKANVMARCLLNQGIKEGDVVVVLVDKSFELVVSILAIVKLGATYLPLEADYPDERLNYIYNDANVSLIILKNRSNNRFNDKKLFYVEDALSRTDISDINLNLEYNPERKIYIIYTSGSTGEPKGVMIKSYSFTNLLNWYTKQFEMDSKDKILLFSSISFDLTQKNIFCTLISGGTLYLYPQSSYNPRLISDLIGEYQITLVNCTPSAFLPLLDYSKKDNYDKLKSLRYIFLGGESISLNLFLGWLNSENSNCKIVNTYGPTECTDIASFFVLDNSNLDTVTTVPIGKPINNVNLYLIDENGNLVVDENVESELYIGGISVGIGYINHDELTNERFVNIPNISSGELYKTGDVVKKLQDGNIEYIGRMDNQVKLHGFRIELEEIEACLNQYSSIKQSIVVMSNSGDTEQVLEAFYTADVEINRDYIVEHLSKHLPHYMIPVNFSKIDEFPLTKNGKIDRKKMYEISENKKNDPVKQTTESSIDLNMSEIEKKVLEIFKSVIENNMISDFNLDTALSDIALNSLSFMKVIVQLEDDFDIEFDDEMLWTEEFTNIKSVVNYIELKC